MQESMGRKPDWLDDNKSFSLKKLCSLLNKSLLKILVQIGRKETGRWFLMHCLSFFCGLEPHWLFSIPQEISFDQFFGSSLLFFGSEHCSGKNVFKSSAFSLKSITNLSLWNTGRMHGILLSFKNVFNIDQ